MVFSPYSTDQIVKIVSSRLASASEASSKFALDDVAIQFCAKKVKLLIVISEDKQFKQCITLKWS